jgi:anti-anti-sigma regulatory factor
MGACVLPESLTIQTVADVRDLLLRAIAGSTDSVEVDGSAVQEVDGAGVQLLLAAGKEAQQRGCRMSLGGSRRLLDTLRLLALQDRFSVANPSAESNP